MTPAYGSMEAVLFLVPGQEVDTQAPGLEENPVCPIPSCAGPGPIGNEMRPERQGPLHR